MDKMPTDDAIILVRQMWTAIGGKDVVVANPDFQSGFDAWCRQAARVLNQADRIELAKPGRATR